MLLRRPQTRKAEGGPDAAAAEEEEEEEDALLPCLKSLVDEVGASAAAMAEGTAELQSSSSGSPKEYAQLGAVYGEYGKGGIEIKDRRCNPM